MKLKYTLKHKLRKYLLLFYNIIIKIKNIKNIKKFSLILLRHKFNNKIY